LSTRNSKLLGHLFEKQKQAVSFYHFIRQFLKAQGFEGFKGFKGYTLTLLVLFFLQQKNLMPKVEDLQRGGFEEFVEGIFIAVNLKLDLTAKILYLGWNVQFSRAKLSNFGTLVMKNYQDHIKDFFQFYSTFDFKKVISTYDGTAQDAASYNSRYPEFVLKGVYIAGPINRSKNCGIVGNMCKKNFISICKSSAQYFVNW